MEKQGSQTQSMYSRDPKPFHKTLCSRPTKYVDKVSLDVWQHYYNDLFKEHVPQDSYDPFFLFSQILDHDQVQCGASSLT